MKKQHQLLLPGLWILLLCLFSFNTSAQETIFDFAEKEPRFPGGEKAMARFIQDNILYPEESRRAGEQGTVYVQFVVNRNGSLSDIRVVKRVSPLLDASAVAVISKMPNWKPGKQKVKLSACATLFLSTSGSRNKTNRVRN